MKRWLRGLGVVLTAVAVLVGGSFLLIETGEVIVLRNADQRGQVFRTRLWVVDYQGAPWISTGNPAKDWFVRVRLQPRVELVRGGEISCRDAVVIEDLATRMEVRRVFQQKYRIQRYGAALLNRLVSPSGAQTEPVLIRLDPCTAGE